MRLGQLARKISIRQSDMVDLLAKSGISIANESNARLEDEHVHVILQHFAPSFLAEKIEEIDVILPEATEESKIITTVNTIEEEPVENVIPKIKTIATEEQEEKVEVIKAPKVDLPGLKVIGKIDLPEPKKKEVPPVEESEKTEVPVGNSETNPKPRPLRSRNVQDNRRERTNRSSINPVALQREREARAVEEKRKADAIKEKEKRTEYYLNRVKTSVPTKAARIYSESVEEYKVPKKDEPKTLLGKFFRWLRSE
ncbi:MAG: hypothetical protein ABI663_14245 [Chryseolinea sp.]